MMYRVIRRPQGSHGSTLLCRYDTAEECKAFIDGLHVAHGDWVTSAEYPLGWCYTYDADTRPDEIVWIEAAP